MLAAQGPRTARLALRVALAALALTWLLKLASIWSWRMGHDTPLLHYAAFLIDRCGFVPYRDLFETSMPGTFAVHVFLGHVLGFGDAAFRLVDVSLLCATMAMCAAFMRRFGVLPSLVSALVFGHLYLAKGPAISLQRDYIGVLPVACALWLLPTQAQTVPRHGRFVMLGVLFGCAMLIKPHLAIAWPVLLWALLALRRQAGFSTWTDALGCVAASIAGLMLPWLLAWEWLSTHGAWAPFTDMVTHYLPLHSAMTGMQQTISGSARWWYVLRRGLGMGGHHPMVALALMSLAMSLLPWRRGPALTPREVTLRVLLGCVIAYTVYPMLAGKFWDYHYMPLVYFCALAIGLLFHTPDTATATPPSPRTHLLAGLALAAMLYLQVPWATYLGPVLSDLRGTTPRTVKDERIDEMAAWLREHLRPGDTVQPLDWTGGTHYAMLRAHARLATRFLYDYHFYHHVSSPYIQGLRRTFMAELGAAAPRFVIEVPQDKPWVSGDDTSREFPELKALLKARYTVVHEAQDYRIHERLPGMAATH